MLKNGKRKAASPLTSYPPDEQSTMSNSLEAELMQFGLTRNQARVYINLLGDVPQTVKDIASVTNLHRVDVYRRLEELQQMGIAENYLGAPQRFRGVNPHLALDLLVERMENSISGLKETTQATESHLEKYILARRSAGMPQVSSRSGSYKLLAGRSNYYAEVRKLIQGARFEVLRVVSSNGVVRSFKNGI